MHASVIFRKEAMFTELEDLFAENALNPLVPGVH